MWETGNVEQTGVAGLAFDLSGGALCLDFANTVDGRPDPVPNDLLGSYSELLAFARQSHALSEQWLERLLAEAECQPAAAEAAHARAIDVREAIYRLFLALADGQSVATSDLDALNRALSEALAHARVDRVADDRFDWGWIDDPISLDAPLW